MTYHAKVIAGGKRGVRLTRAFMRIVREEQKRFRVAVGSDYSVDHFLAEKSADWREGG